MGRRACRAAKRRLKSPLPSSTTGRESEREALIKKSVSGKLTAAEEARLQELYEARLSNTAPPPPSVRTTSETDYQKLIKKSIGNGLSAAENERLHELAESRTEAPASSQQELSDE